MLTGDIIALPFTLSMLQASCLCGSAPCLLCGCCPSSNNSTVTRLIFSFFLLLGTLVSVIMILPGMETQLRKVGPPSVRIHFTCAFNALCWFSLFLMSLQIPGFCQGGTTIPGIDNHVNCDVILGYKSVYRMCFAMACFFFLFSAIMIRVKSSKDPRAAIQNGWVWLMLYDHSFILLLFFFCVTFTTWI